jgi:hypothetical protein
MAYDYSQAPKKRAIELIPHVHDLRGRYADRARSGGSALAQRRR